MGHRPGPLQHGEVVYLRRLLLENSSPLGACKKLGGAANGEGRDSRLLKTKRCARPYFQDSSTLCPRHRHANTKTWLSRLQIPNSRERAIKHWVADIIQRDKETSSANHDIEVQCQPVTRMGFDSRISAGPEPKQICVVRRDALGESLARSGHIGPYSTKPIMVPWRHCLPVVPCVASNNGKSPSPAKLSLSLSPLRPYQPGPCWFRKVGGPCPCLSGNLSGIEIVTNWHDHFKRVALVSDAPNPPCPSPILADSMATAWTSFLAAFAASD